MNTKKIPAIISLVAGIVSLIVTYVSKVELVRTLTTLFIVLLSFYILGCIVKAIMDKHVVEDEEPEDEDEEELENIDTNEETDSESDEDTEDAE